MSRETISLAGSSREASGTGAAMLSMIRPVPAFVPPRVISPETGDSLLLEDTIREQAMARERGIIELIGSFGMGKSTALGHLAATLGEFEHLVLLDEPDEADVLSAASGGLVVYTSITCRSHAPKDLHFPLAPWSEDDIQEYLWRRVPDRCGAILDRLRNDPMWHQLPGVPALWRLALDELIDGSRSDSLLVVFTRVLQRHLGNAERWRMACREGLDAIVASHPIYGSATSRRIDSTLSDSVSGLLRHRSLKWLLAADQLRAILRAECDDVLPREILDEHLLRFCGENVAADRESLRRLRRKLKVGWKWFHPAVASILVASGQPLKLGRGVRLERAFLTGIDWRGINLSRANLGGSRLDRANLSQARLDRAQLVGCGFRDASLQGALCRDVQFREADLTGADLRQIHADRANFQHASLREARVDDAVLVGVDFRHSDLSRACFRGANLAQATLVGAQIEGTDFREANLSHVHLQDLPLRYATLDGACLAGARLDRCDLEQVELSDADLAGAKLLGTWLTGSRMPRVNLRGAKLCYAALADIKWEHADLRFADFSGCSFHMGSSRSGLVGSPFPCHGSRTGFYTDSFEEQYFKSPEEIRVADLCGADLRGARLTNTDFYLVDLRGARYDPDQADHFRHCKAILTNPR